MFYFDATTFPMAGQSYSQPDPSSFSLEYLKQLLAGSGTGSGAKRGPVKGYESLEFRIYGENRVVEIIGSEHDRTIGVRIEYSEGKYNVLAMYGSSHNRYEFIVSLGQNANNQKLWDIEFDNGHREEGKKAHESIRRALGAYVRSRGARRVNGKHSNLVLSIATSAGRIISDPLYQEWAMG